MDWGVSDGRMHSAIFKIDKQQGSTVKMNTFYI